MAQRLAAPGLGFKEGFGEQPEILTFSLTTPMLLPDGHRAGMVFETWRHGSGWTVTADRRDGRWIVVNAFGWAT